MDRKKLEDAIMRFRVWGCSPQPLNHEVFCNMVDAAEAHLATLPKSRWRVTAHPLGKSCRVEEWFDQEEARLNAKAWIDAGVFKIEIEKL